MPVTKTDDDDSYRVRSTALVRNNTYDGDVLGTVLVSAKNTSEPCDVGVGGIAVPCDGDNSHQFTARVLLRRGGSIECSESRSHVWSGNKYEDIVMICDERLSLSDVKSVQIESS